MGDTVSKTPKSRTQTRTGQETTTAVIVTATETMTVIENASGNEIETGIGIATTTEKVTEAATEMAETAMIAATIDLQHQALTIVNPTTHDPHTMEMALEEDLAQHQEEERSEAGPHRSREAVDGCTATI